MMNSISLDGAVLVLFVAVFPYILMLSSILQQVGYCSHTAKYLNKREN